MPKTPLRALRLDDELWKAVQDKAAKEGRSVTEVVRELLGRWVTRPVRKAPGGTVRRAALTVSHMGR